MLDIPNISNQRAHAPLDAWALNHINKKLSIDDSLLKTDQLFQC